MSTKAQMHARACHTSMKTSCYSGTFKIWGFWRHPDAVVHYDHAGRIPSGAAAGEKARREQVYVKPSAAGLQGAYAPAGREQQLLRYSTPGSRATASGATPLTSAPISGGRVA